MKKNLNSDACFLINKLGGTFAVAALCGISPSAVSQWKANGISKGYMRFIQERRPDLFSPSRN